MSNSYRDLVVWQVAVDLALDTYKITESFPKHELYGLTGQIRRCAVSISSNIAEGQGRNSPGEFRQFVGNAKGSSVEWETQAYIAHKLGYISPAQYEELQQKCDRLSRLLNGLLHSLKSAPRPRKVSEGYIPDTRNQKRATDL